MKKKLLPELMTIVIVVIMVLMSEIFKEREFIFPEITALAVGAWLAPKQVWKTNRIKLVILISLYAIFGVILVRYVNIDIYFEVILGFVVCLFGLYVSKTTFAPLISAMILPIIINSESWLYPIFATIMAIMVVLGQKFLEKYEYRHDYKYILVENNLKDTLYLNIQRIGALMIVAFIAFELSLPFLIAPPIIVAFVELSSNHPKLRSQVIKLLVLVFVMTFIGAYGRLLFSDIYKLPLTFSAMVSVIIMIIMMKGLKLYFPPAGALAILPLLIETDKLIIYPFVVTSGFIIFIIIAFIITKTPISVITK